MTYRGKLKDWETMTKQERMEAIDRLGFLNSDGEAVGYLVGDYLVGEILESCDEYITLEWWMPCVNREPTDDPVTTYDGGRWYNPTRQEKADEWARRTSRKERLV